MQKGENDSEKFKAMMQEKQTLAFTFTEEDADILDRLKIISLRTGKPLDLVLQETLEKGIDRIDAEYRERKTSMN